MDLLFKEVYMGKRFDILLFPGGKNKAFTLSYDDGVVQDRKLVGIFDRYNVKCTFNLNGGALGYISPPEFPIDISKIPAEEIRDLYRNHEVGGHTLYHSDVTALGSPQAMHEILDDKRILEQLTGKLVKMFAYPFGVFSDEVKPEQSRFSVI